MDFSKFRDSGELSDITVQVDAREFHLHKFPLYIKSDFFRALARRASQEKDFIKLEEFPGSSDTFEVVANYCYNKKVEITRDNVCHVRCAAEFLQMTTPGNLADHADRYLLDTITAAKLGRDVDSVIDLLLNCISLGAIAEQADLVQRLIGGVIDCWLLATKWTRRLPPEMCLGSQDTFHKVCCLPLTWFKMLFIAAKNKSVRSTVLAKLVQTYISMRIESHQRASQKTVNGKKPKGRRETDKELVSIDKETGKSDMDNKDKPEPPAEDSDQLISPDKNKDDSDGSCVDPGTQAVDAAEGKQKDREADVPSDMCNADVGHEGDDEEDAEDDEDDTNAEFICDTPIGVVLDTLLLELPENAPLVDTFDPHWAATILSVAEENNCTCRPLLLRLAGHLLHRFSPSDLGQMSPNLLQEIIEETSRAESTSIDKDTLCTVVDGYLLELANLDKLPIDTFTKMAGSVPDDFRKCHDTLFGALEKLLTSTSVSVGEEDKEQLLKLIDFRLLSESVLQHAYDSQLVPTTYITQAALALCARLRADLEAARQLIRAQEEELDRFGLGATRTPHPSAPPTTRGSGDTEYGCPVVGYYDDNYQDLAPCAQFEGDNYPSPPLRCPLGDPSGSPSESTDTNQDDILVDKVLSTSYYLSDSPRVCYSTPSPYDAACGGSYSPYRRRPLSLATKYTNPYTTYVASYWHSSQCW